MKQPNILHFFVDQQRFDTLSALNNPVIHTPNLDRLIRRGVAFTSAYTSCPVCVAARCSMIYGQYPGRTGCLENTAMPDDRSSFMEILRQNGYHTHGIGKCHFFPDPFARKGFDIREHQEEYVPAGSSDEPYYDLLRQAHYDYVMEPNGSRGEMYYIPQISQLPEHLHPTAWIAQRSLEFLKTHKNSDQPWYLFSSFIHPHPPFCPPNPWHKLYRSALMPLPNVPQDSEQLITFVNRVQNRYKYKDQGLDKNLIRTLKAYYYGCISFIDYQIGQILDYLDESGLADNTMIVFTADHGELLGDYNSFGKRSFHDAAARIPMIVSMKGRFEGGLICDRPVSLVDLAPTFLHAAGVNAPDMALDGVDLAEILSGSTRREMVFGEHSYDLGNPIEEGRPIPPEFHGDAALFRAARTTYMAVSDRWKYIYSAGDDREFLFDRVQDPLETRNKAHLTFTKEITAAMRRSLIRHLQQENFTAGVEDGQFRHFPPYQLPEDPDEGLLIQDLYVPGVRSRVDLSGYDRQEEPHD